MTTLREQVEQFLYTEARLMDEHQYEEWESLWADEATYWVPSNEYDIDPSTHISLIYDDRDRLSQRIGRLKSGMAHAQDPQSRLRRVISNIEFKQEENGDVVVYSNFNLVEVRRGRQNVWAGRTIHRLSGQDGNFKITFKKVDLVNNDEDIPNLVFLI